MKTTREAALKSCKDRLKHLENAPSHHCGKRQRQRAIELEKVKIEALRPITREQVEKVWRGCDLCLDDSWQRILMIPKRFDHTNMLSAELAQFCPGCGRPLTDEAVDMVMERISEMEEMTNEH